MRLTILAAVLCLSPSAWASMFTITSLGDAGFDTEASAINAYGQAAVTSFLPGFDFMATCINGQGHIAGTTFTDFGAMATLYQNGQAMAVANFGGESYAHDVNDAGQVAGSAGNRAYIAQDGNITWLNHPISSIHDAANAINEQGVVAGTMIDPWGISRGYTWYNGQTTWTGTLGGMNTGATNLNDNGQSVGYAQTGDGFMHAFLAGDGYITDLGTLGGFASYAYGINNNGDVVGYSWRADGALAAFLYTNGIMLDLSSFVINLDGWMLATAYGINDQGQIVGTGFYNGRRTAYRLDPFIPTAPLAFAATSIPTVHNPEPSTITLICFGIAGILFSRRLGNTRKSD